MNDSDLQDLTMEELIERSSLGTPAAKAIRARTPPEVVAAIQTRLALRQKYSSDMAIRVEDLHRFSVDQYLRMADGDPAAFERTELINGVVRNMPPQGFLHSKTAPWIWTQLEQRYPGRVLAGVTIKLATSAREPDVVVVRQDYDGTEISYPSGGDVALAIEVSVTTTDRDLGEKLHDFASDGVPVYWVVNPRTDGWLMIHTEPSGNHYAKVTRIELPDGYLGLDFDLLDGIVE